MKPGAPDPADAGSTPTAALAAYGALGLPLAFAALPIYVHVPRLYAEGLGLSLALVYLTIIMIAEMIIRILAILKPKRNQNAKANIKVPIRTQVEINILSRYFFILFSSQFKFF